MSYKKIKVIGPESVRKPEIGYVYLGYGYSTTFDDTAPWIKKEDGSFYLISGGTGGGESGAYVPYINAIKNVDLGNNDLTVGGETSVQYLDVGGRLDMTTTDTKIQAATRSSGGAASINLPPATTPSSLSNGDVWTTSTSIYARINGVTKDLAATGGDSFWVAWSTNGIRYTDGSAIWVNKAYIGSTVSYSTNDDLLTVKGAITLSDTTKTNVGTIRYNTSTSDFEGYIGTKWYSLTAGEHTADTNEFIYNDSGGALVGAPTLKYSTGGIAVNLTEATAYSSFEVNGSFGTETTFTSSNLTLDETHHTIICTNSSPTDINITLSPLAVSINREYTICRYGTGNISIGVSVETPYTQYIRFYDVDNSWLDFDTDRPLGSSDKLILYSVTLRATYSGGLYRWYVTHFSSASTP